MSSVIMRINRLSTMNGIKDLALTTNGSLLTDYAVKLKKAGLKRQTVSLDSLDPQIFKTLSGTNSVFFPISNPPNGVSMAIPSWTWSVLQEMRAYAPFYRIYGCWESKSLGLKPSGGFQFT